jgi:hypothetical protein
MPKPWTIAFLKAWPAAAFLAYGCAEPRAAPAACEARIIVDFASPTEPDAIGTVARDHSLTLGIVRRPLANVYVLDLSTGPALTCDGALASLRADARIRSADLDARRQPH